jgi:hypothetical protein
VATEERPLTAKISGDGQTITGPWEICHDGTIWQHDF